MDGDRLALDHGHVRPIPLMAMRIGEAPDLPFELIDVRTLGLRDHGEDEMSCAAGRLVPDEPESSHLHRIVRDPAFRQGEVSDIVGGELGLPGLDEDGLAGGCFNLNGTRGDRNIAKEYSGQERARCRAKAQQHQSGCNNNQNDLGIAAHDPPPGMLFVVDFTLITQRARGKLHMSGRSERNRGSLRAASQHMQTAASYPRRVRL